MASCLSSSSSASWSIRPQGTNWLLLSLGPICLLPLQGTQFRKCCHGECPKFYLKTRSWGIWLRLPGQIVEYKVSGPQGSCLSHLAPQDLLGPVLPFFFFSELWIPSQWHHWLSQGAGGKPGPVCIHACLYLTERKMVQSLAAVVREGQVKYTRDKRVLEGPTCFLKESPDPGPTPATRSGTVHVC